MQSHQIIILELNDLKAFVRSQNGKKEVDRCTKTVKGEFRAYRRLQKEHESIKAELSASKAEHERLKGELAQQIEVSANHEKEAQSYRLQLTVAINPGLSYDCLQLIGNNNQPVMVSRQLAITSSPHIKVILER